EGPAGGASHDTPGGQRMGASYPTRCGRKKVGSGADGRPAGGSAEEEGEEDYGGPECQVGGAHQGADQAAAPPDQAARPPGAGRGGVAQGPVSQLRAPCPLPGGAGRAPGPVPGVPADPGLPSRPLLTAPSPPADPLEQPGNLTRRLGKGAGRAERFRESLVWGKMTAAERAEEHPSACCCATAGGRPCSDPWPPTPPGWPGTAAPSPSWPRRCTRS